MKKKKDEKRKKSKKKKKKDNKGVELDEIKIDRSKKRWQLAICGQQSNEYKRMTEKTACEKKKGRKNKHKTSRWRKSKGFHKWNKTSIFNKKKKKNMVLKLFPRMKNNWYPTF